MFRILTLLTSCALLVCSPAHAATAAVTDAKIVKIDFYGGQFTAYLDTVHNLPACGHLNSFSVDATTPAGQAQVSALLTAWTTGKRIYVVVNDGLCYGDRPTIIMFAVYD